MTPEEFDRVAREAIQSLRRAADHDWSKHAGTLEWTCWETIDHTIDCVFSYALQLASRADTGFLPFGELHAKAEASNTELLDGLDAVARMLHDLVVCAPPEATASDGVVLLGLTDWCARGAYEIALHTHDVLSGLDVRWQLPDELCDSIMSSPLLWMFDRAKPDTDADPWTMLLVGAGRPAPV